MGSSIQLCTTFVQLSMIAHKKEYVEFEYVTMRGTQLALCKWLGGQFHQHFTSSFSDNFLLPKKYKSNKLLVYKSCANHFRMKKLLVKCWWNWNLVAISQREKKEGITLWAYFSLFFELLLSFPLQNFLPLFFVMIGGWLVDEGASMVCLYDHKVEKVLPLKVLFSIGIESGL